MSLFLLSAAPNQVILMLESGLANAFFYITKIGDGLKICGRILAH